MTFSDEDLKRLKDKINGKPGPAFTVDLRKLVARMEAGEMFINHWTIENRDRWRALSGKDKQPGWEAIYTKRKRKAAGRDSNSASEAGE